MFDQAILKEAVAAFRKKYIPIGTVGQEIALAADLQMTYEKFLDHREHCTTCDHSNDPPMTPVDFTVMAMAVHMENETKKMLAFAEALLGFEDELGVTDIKLVGPGVFAIVL